MLDPNSLNPTNSTLAERRAVFEPYFSQAELAHGIPTGLLLQQGIAESNLDPTARSSAGAVGIMQMMPRYFPNAGLDALADIETAAREMARLFAAFGSWTLALAGYNAGQGAVQQYGGVPPFTETQDYVAKITKAAGISEPGVVWA